MRKNLTALKLNSRKTCKSTRRKRVMIKGTISKWERSVLPQHLQGRLAQRPLHLRKRRRKAKFQKLAKNPSHNQPRGRKKNRFIKRNTKLPKRLLKKLQKKSLLTKRLN